MSLAPDFIGFIEGADPRWKATLARTAFDFFHLPAYLQASAGHEGGTPVLFALEAGECGLAVPLILRRLDAFGTPFAGTFDATSPYGYPGPLVWGEGWRERLPELFEAFFAFLRRERIISLFLRLNPFMGPGPEDLAALGDLKAHGPTVYMDLRDPAGTWSGIHEPNRRFITKLLKRGFTVAFDRWDTMDTVIASYYETMERLAASPFYFFPRGYFQELREGAGAHLHLATGYTPAGEILGGAFFTEVHGLIHYYLMGAFEDYLDASPSKLLVNSLRLWGLERGHRTLHLGGGQGARRDSLFEFKRRLSDLTVTFCTFRKVLLPEVYEDLARITGRQGSTSDFFPAYRIPAGAPLSP